MNTKFFAALAAALATCVAACATTNETSVANGGLDAAATHFASTQPQLLQPFFRTLYIEGEHNAVLNFDYLGLAALETGHYGIASRAFDAAITRINAIYADNPSAEKAKSVFAAEKVKDFKGEPYERAMTYFYRGLLYARVGDYENARASFLSAEEQSMMSERESYADTFGLMDFLAGWASHCDGDDARADQFGARASKVQPTPFASLSDRVSYVGLADVGRGPVKYAAGKYQQELAFRPAMPGPIPAASITASNAIVGPTYLGANIDYQAMTRGGRPVDAILNGKAVWKRSTATAANALAGAGEVATIEGVLNNNSSLEMGGELSMAAGLVSGLFSRAMTAKADTREWASLPAGIEVATGQLEGTVLPVIAVSSESGGSSSTIPLNVRAGNCAFSWTKVPSLLNLAASQMSSPRADEAQHRAENAALRSFLQTTFPGAPSQPAQAAQESSSAERQR